MKGVSQTERRLLEELSADELIRHVEYLCQLDRTSSSDGENEAIDYLVRDESSGDTSSGARV